MARHPFVDLRQRDPRADVDGDDRKAGRRAQRDEGDAQVDATVAHQDYRLVRQP
jgi:hypothetical protein